MGRFSIVVNLPKTENYPKIAVGVILTKKTCSLDRKKSTIFSKCKNRTVRHILGILWFICQSIYYLWLRMFRDLFKIKRTELFYSCIVNLVPTKFTFCWSRVFLVITSRVIAIALKYIILNLNLILITGVIFTLIWLREDWSVESLLPRV